MSLNLAKSMITNVSYAVEKLSSEIDEEFQHAVNLILSCKDRVIITGMGKSGHIASKAAATFSSTGTLAHFVHPSEASHGDLGMISTHDLVIALSKSGESPELYDIVNYCKTNNVKLIAITQKKLSALGKAADCILKLPEVDEVGPHNLAPTTSTTLTVVLCDALAMCCMKARNFSPKEFKRYHPGGKLGKKLTSIKEVMSTQLPLVSPDASIMDATIVMSQGLKGCVGIVENDCLVGIFTDGDLRRTISQNLLTKTKIKEVMTINPHKVFEDMRLDDVSNFLTKNKISSVFICSNEKPIGIIHLHDLLKEDLI